ncbi:MAG: hypothetical protein WAM14_09845 [Candidatus Nitrosopolaris sp.]
MSNNPWQRHIFHTFSGTGMIHFQDDLALEVSFSVHLLDNVRFIGDLLYKGIFLENIYEYFNKMKYFTLRGTDQSNESKTKQLKVQYRGSWPGKASSI